MISSSHPLDLPPRKAYASGGSDTPGRRAVSARYSQESTISSGASKVVVLPETGAGINNVRPAAEIVTVAVEGSRTMTACAVPASLSTVSITVPVLSPVAGVAALLVAVAACGDSGQSDTARFCEIDAEFDAFAQADLTQFTPSEFEEFMRAGVDLVDEAAEVAPSEIRPEAERAAVGFHAALQLYEEASFDLTQLDPAAAEMFLSEHDEEVERASAVIDEWARENC